MSCSDLRIAVLLAMATAHCQATDIVVADLPPDDDAGTHMRHGDPCTDSSNCHEDEFCDKSACNAKVGHCRHRQGQVLACPANLMPVCGCDDVTYWNDCLRGAAGVAASVPGECSTGALCGGPSATACPAGAFCAQLVPEPGPCMPSTTGTCWVLPATCPDDAGTSMWSRCSDPHSCTNACTAIRAQVPYHKGCP